MSNQNAAKFWKRKNFLEKWYSNLPSHCYLKYKETYELNNEIIWLLNNTKYVSCFCSIRILFVLKCLIMTDVSYCVKSSIHQLLHYLFYETIRIAYNYETKIRLQKFWRIRKILTWLNTYVFATPNKLFCHVCHFWKSRRGGEGQKNIVAGGRRVTLFSV